MTGKSRTAVTDDDYIKYVQLTKVRLPGESMMTIIFNFFRPSDIFF